jgi:hypothetical protein
MTCNYHPLTCKSCGAEFKLLLHPILLMCPPQYLVDNFLCQDCGSRTEEGRKFLDELEAYLDKFR